MGEDMQFEQTINSIRRLCIHYEQALNTATPSALMSQITQYDNLWNRKNYFGHITASAIVFDHADKKILLVKNKSLELWLAPGGHGEEFEMPLETAIRELVEETGIQSVSLHSWHTHLGVPIDIDSHTVPENFDKGEPEHTHHDFRYLFSSSVTTSFAAQTLEIDGIEWRPVDNEVESLYPRVYERMLEISSH